MCFNWHCMAVFVIAALLTQSDARRVGLNYRAVPQNTLSNVLNALQRDISKLKSIVAEDAFVSKTNFVDPNFSGRQRNSVANNLQYMTRYQTAANLLRKCGKALVFPFSRSHNRHSLSYQDCIQRLQSVLKELPSKTKFYVQPPADQGKNTKNKKPFVDLTRSDEDIYLQSNADGQRDSRKYLDSNRNYHLPYFLPKRWFWQERDLPNLDTFWYHGPLGVQVIFR